AGISLDHFERITKPRRVSAGTTQHLAEFASQRRQERGRRPGGTISPASVNKGLRHIKAALAMAVEPGLLRKPPKGRLEEAPKKLPRYVHGEHFAVIYAACDKARLPVDQPYPASDWWRALVVTAYMTGWRIGDLLALRRDHLDLDAGTAVSLEGDNKGKRG